jgi:Apea-like HEPN
MNDLDIALDDLKNLIRDLHLQKPSENFYRDFHKIDVWHISTANGGFALDKAKAQKYRAICQSIFKSVRLEDKLSFNSLDKAIKQLIIFTLDMRSRRADIDFDVRLDNDVREFRKKLTSSLPQWRVCLPVFGLENSNLPYKIGKVTFCIFSGELREEYDNYIDTDGYEEEFNAQLRDKTVAIVEVEALDNDTIIELALRELRFTLGCINFFANLLQPPSLEAYISYSEDVGPSFYVVSIAPAQSLWNVRFPKVTHKFDFRKVDSIHAQTKGFKRIKDLFARKSRSDLEERLLSAVNWAGRAVVESRREERFLLYAIALESLLLKSNDTELSYRLRIRVAQLIGGDISLNERKSIVRDVRNLYNVRSKIVHSGHYEVTLSDINLMQHISTNCILRVLMDDPFSTMQSLDQLEQWFEDKTLELNTDSAVSGSKDQLAAN